MLQNPLTKTLTARSEGNESSQFWKVCVLRTYRGASTDWMQCMFMITECNMSCGIPVCMLFIL